MISHYKQFRTGTLRLQHRDYSQPGYYFITLCINNHERLFGLISQGEMMLNDFGCIVEKCWLDLPNHYHDIELDAHVVMPNHFHGIVKILDHVETGLKPVSDVINQNAGEMGLKPISTSFIQLKQDKQHGLSELVRALKTFSARRINELRHTIGKNIWQYGYYDHIIRDNRSLQRIRTYILNNPVNWKDDRFYQL
jgi:putative transposase